MDVLEDEEADVAFYFPISISVQNIMDQCAHEQTVCTITRSHDRAECKISGRLENCCRTLHGLLNDEMHRLKQCKKKTVTINDTREWSQLVGINGCINKAIRHLSGACVWIEESGSFPKSCTIKGFPEQVQVAEKLIEKAQQGRGKDLTMEATHENILARLKNDLEKFCHFEFTV